MQAVAILDQMAANQRCRLVAAGFHRNSQYACCGY
jgi:hypothetical protein